ncbi:Hypothetical protein, putative [Bodo saltans]|uniref:Uncharacterized protein n=1 Tax=Bodo saltans TaxID=75058 RepID=A0A0S4KF83_BODSA|nr:Hypothetical protein, putative [Bodo saltans]|eukprot:CUI14306.1 Hypothetical protein, putative [Bodo saltans]
MTDVQGVNNGLVGPTDVGVSSVTTDSSKRDVRYEVLDMNSQGMYMCQQQQLDEAEAILTQAYNVLENDNTVHDAQTLDQLRSTTLNNLGVVECHKGLHKQALNHLEVAQTLEHQWDVHSPSVSLNICAACNALGMYDRATSAALDTIEMLRQSAKSAAEGTLHHSGTVGSGTEHDPTATSPTAAAAGNSENSVLWGAAWHNLAVAQLNIASGKDLSEYTNVLALFHNAMESTTALLGAQHPMTGAVHETYRSIRQHLREAGVYKQHRALLTCELPPVSGKAPPPEAEPGLTTHATAVKQSKDFHLTLRGKETGGKKVVERYSSEAFPSALGGGSSGTTPRRTPRGTAINSPRNTVSDYGASARSGSTKSIQKRGQSPIRGIPLSGNLLAASALYRNPHPLLFHPKLRPVDYVPKLLPNADSGRGGRDALPAIGKSAQGSSSPPKYREQLSEEMWVEAVNRHQTTTSPRRQGNNPASKPARPVYSQQLYALDSVNSDQHRVNQPVQSAQSVGGTAPPAQ